MKVYLSPIVSDKQQTIKFKNEIVQVTVDGISYVYDFSNLPNGELVKPTEHIINAKRENGELFVEIVNCIDENATEEERFPQWQTIERNDVLDLNAQVVPIEWITIEEIEAEKNAPKLPTAEERLTAIEMALIDLTLGGM